MRRLAMLVVCLGLGLGACGRDDTEQMGRTMEDAGSAAADAAREDAAEAADAAQEMADDAAQAAGEAADAAAQAGDAAADAAAQAGDAAADAAAAAGEAAAGAGDAAAPAGGSQGCLDLVAASRFSEAVPVCTQALAEDPTNPAVKDALDRARAATGP